MKYRVALLAIVALAGCHKAETGTAAAGNTSAAAGNSAETAAAAPSTPVGAMQMKPGAWEMTTEVLAMDIPGMPAGMSPKGMTQKSTFKTCMKPQDKPDGSFFQGKQNKDCTYKDFAMSGGHIHGTATCNNAGQHMTMTMDGQYAAESYDMTMDMKGDQMSMKMHTAGHRTGDCTAS